MSCADIIYSEDVYDFIVSNSTYLENYQKSECSIDIDEQYTLDYISSEELPPFSMANFVYSTVPKCYAPLSEDALEATGILYVRNLSSLSLRGEGILMGFVDTGIDYRNPVFNRPTGDSRIAAIWDQTDSKGSDFLLQPAYGTVYTQDEINQALQSDAPEAVVPSLDEVGHGTYVASIAAGSYLPEENFSGGAPMSNIAMVKCKPAKRYLTDYFYINPETMVYQENDIMAAVQFLDRLATLRNQSLVICIALGTALGSHGGTSPLCHYLNSLAQRFRRCIVTATGNEAGAGHHFYGILPQNNLDQRPQVPGPLADDYVDVEIQVGDNVPGFVMEQWALSPQLYQVSLLSPSGELRPVSVAQLGGSQTYRFIIEGTEITTDENVAEGSMGNQLIFFRFTNPAAGIWRLRVSLRSGSSGRFHIFLPMTSMLQGNVYFLRPSPETTLLSPSDALRVISAGGYNDSNNSLYLASGRGLTLDGNIKPDFVAPAVDVTGAANVPASRPASLRYVVQTGTSASAAFAAAASALALEWLVENVGNNATNTTTVKNFLIRGTTKVPNELFPNASWGYGIMDVYQSFLNLR